jgi:hypothetical protein
MRDSPSALAGTILLSLLGVDIDMARLGEVTGEVFSCSGSAISESGVVTVIELV